MPEQRYLSDAEYYEGYWDSVYEQEYRYHGPTDLDYAPVSDRDWRDMKADHDYDAWREEQDDAS